MIEQALSELLELAKERLDRTDDPYRREKLALGVAEGAELLELLEATALLRPAASEEVLSFLDVIRPLVARKIGRMLLFFHEGGLFEGEDGRTADEFRVGAED